MTVKTVSTELGYFHIDYYALHNDRFRNPISVMLSGNMITLQAHFTSEEVVSSILHLFELQSDQPVASFIIRGGCNCNEC
jgi:hypothetical protein